MVHKRSADATNLKGRTGIGIHDARRPIGDQQTVVPDLSATLNHVVHVGQRAITGVIHNRLAATVRLAQDNRARSGQSYCAIDQQYGVVTIRCGDNLNLPSVIDGAEQLRGAVVLSNVNSIICQRALRGSVQQHTISRSRSQESAARIV